MSTSPCDLESSLSIKDECSEFRGYCLYKTGKCSNERAMKTNGQPHNLCDLHRAKQNQNQRKMDTKMRLKKHYSPYETSPRRNENHFTISPPCESFVHKELPSYPVQYSPMKLPTLSYRQHYVHPSSSDQVISLPTPSFLHGAEREAFRARVLKKLLTVISEEAAPRDLNVQQKYPEAPYQSQPLPRLPSLASCISRHYGATDSS